MGLDAALPVHLSPLLHSLPLKPVGTHISGRLGKENNLELGLALRMPALEVARIRGSQSLLAAASFCSSAKTLDGLAVQWRGEG